MTGGHKRPPSVVTISLLALPEQIRVNGRYLPNQHWPDQKELPALCVGVGAVRRPLLQTVADALRLYAEYLDEIAADG